MTLLTQNHQNRFIDCPVRFQATRLKNFFPSEWHREHQIVYMKTDMLKVTGRVPSGAALISRFFSASECSLTTASRLPASSGH